MLYSVEISRNVHQMSIAANLSWLVLHLEILPVVVLVNGQVI